MGGLSSCMRLLLQALLLCAACDAVHGNANGVNVSGTVVGIFFAPAYYKCIDLPGGDTTNGNKLQLWDCNGHDNQQWVFTEGTYKIVYAGDPNKCVDVPGGDTTDGNHLQIWDCNGADGQKWGYDSNMKTIYLASSADASKCMDLTGGDTTNGQSVQIWDCNGTPNQQWQFTAPPVPPPAPPAPSPSPQPPPAKACLASAANNQIRRAWSSDIESSKANLTNRPRSSKLSASGHPYGPYTVKTGTIGNVPGLSLGGPYSADVVYGEPQSANEYLPFISFAHGTGAGGASLMRDYTEDLELVASYGFVIVAAQSCPQIECFSSYCKDQQQTIRACNANRNLHPALQFADFSNVGVYGHSMGAMATLGSVGGAPSQCKRDDSLNIRAAVSQHPCQDAFLNTKDINVPIMFTAGSADTICEDGCSQKYYNEIANSPSKIMIDFAGESHFCPTAFGDRAEVPAVAFFLSCRLRGENCDKVYGSSGRAICDQTWGGKMYSCQTYTVGNDTTYV